MEKFEIEDINVEQRSERELKREYHIVTADKRLDHIARNFVEHYSTAWRNGKVMLVHHNISFEEETEEDRISAPISYIQDLCYGALVPLQESPSHFHYGILDINRYLDSLKFKANSIGMGISKGIKPGSDGISNTYIGANVIREKFIFSD